MDIQKKLTKKASKKHGQGEKADPKAEGRMNKQIGLGDAMAQALGSAQQLSGSKNGFLGVEKQSIDVKSYSTSLDDKK